MTDKPLVPTPAALLEARADPDLVDVPPRSVLTVEGEGAPAGPTFAAAVGMLYAAAYTLRFARKAAARPVFKVGPLEGEWHAEGARPGEGGLPDASSWAWVLRIGVPDDVTADGAEAAAEAAAKKRAAKRAHPAEGGLATSVKVRLARLEAGRFARILHVGPYATEPDSFAKIAALLAAEGLDREPWHLEVYLSDPGRTAPEKLKTVLLTRIRS